MTPQPQDVQEAIKHLADFILRYAVTLAAVSALSMALIEMVKALLSWRDQFHKRRVCRWIKEASLPKQDLLQIDPTLTSMVANVDFRSLVYIQLIRLTTGETVGPAAIDQPIEALPWIVSPGNALFSLELPKMMGQIQDAADTALGQPHAYPFLYLFLTAGSEGKDVKDWYVWAQQPPTSTTADEKLAKDQSDTYARLRQFIRRRLDAFQLSASYRWKTGNQFASVILGAMLLFGCLAYIARDNPPENWLGWAGLAFASLIGGVMAPVAKDLVVALRRMRSGV